VRPVTKELAVANEYPVQIYEMMARLGIELSAAVLPRLSLRYATLQLVSVPKI
jgi:hypothetical protein